MTIRSNFLTQSQNLPDFGPNKVENVSFMNKSNFASDMGESIDLISQKLYLSEKTILGEDYSVMWIDLCKYYPDRGQEIKDYQAKFSRTKTCSNTLVFDLVGTCLRIVEPRDI